MDVTRFPERSKLIRFALDKGDSGRPEKKIEIGTGQWPMTLRVDRKTLQF